MLTLEIRWCKRFPPVKPLSIHTEPDGDQEAWEPSITKHWLSWLEAEPEALDSLDIIDDLALNEPSLADVSDFGQRRCEPLVKRRRAILKKAPTVIPSDAALP